MAQRVVVMILETPQKQPKGCAGCLVLLLAGLAATFCILYSTGALTTKAKDLAQKAPTPIAPGKLPKGKGGPAGPGANELDEADRLYGQGKITEAVERYKRQFPSLPADRQTDVLRRIVDHESEKGDVQEARRWIETGRQKELSPTYESASTVAIVAQLKAEEEKRVKEAEQERAAELARKQEARIKKILADMKSAEVDTRREAVLALAELGDRAKEGIPDLAQAVLDKDRSLRLAALDALKKLAGDAKPAVPNLAKALSSMDAATRQKAIQVLAALGPDAQPAASALVALLADKEHWEPASQALVRIGKGAVPALTKGLDSSSALTRQKSARCLGEIGPDARDALPALTARAQTDASVSVREDATTAIGRIKR
jgi:hypothetical protein